MCLWKEELHLKPTCFVPYLKIINTVLTINISILNKLSEKLRNQAVFDLLTKQYFARFDQYNSRTIWPAESQMPFLSLSDNLLKDAYIIIIKKKNSVDNSQNSTQNMLYFCLSWSNPILKGKSYSNSVQMFLVCTEVTVCRWCTVCGYP